MKRSSFFFALLLSMIMISQIAIAQGTSTGITSRTLPQGSPYFKWTVPLAAFDSAATVWSNYFSFDGYTASTFDAQGHINLGTKASAAGTYSTILLMYGSNDPLDDNSWILVDSLGTITSTTVTKIEIDLDDWDQCMYYKIKAYNNGYANSFVLALKSEYVR